MIQLFLGIVLGMGGVGRIESAADTASLVLGVCLSILGGIMILRKVAQ